MRSRHPQLQRFELATALPESNGPPEGTPEKAAEDVYRQPPDKDRLGIEQVKHQVLAV
ncbi:MAG: hypothetical protein OXC26_17105 [Albidovulum sp.]|nr:hypothetical protein [Albidovulum sp.]